MHEFVVSEMTRLRIDELVREGCRLRRARRSERATVPTAGRVGCLPAEGSA